MERAPVMCILRASAPWLVESSCGWCTLTRRNTTERVHAPSSAEYYSPFGFRLAFSCLFARVLGSRGSLRYRSVNPFKDSLAIRERFSAHIRGSLLSRVCSPSEEPGLTHEIVAHPGSFRASHLTTMALCSYPAIAQQPPIDCRRSERPGLTRARR